MTRRGAALFLAAVGALACDATAPPEKAPLSFTLCPNIHWFAYRNGDASWESVTLPSDHRVTIQAEPRLSIAYSIALSLQERVTYVINAAREELDGIKGPNCPSNPGPMSVTATVTGANVGPLVLSAPGTSILSSNPTFTHTLEGLPAGPIEVIASRQSIGGSVDRIIVRRGVVASGQTLPSFDLAGEESQWPAAYGVTLHNVGSGIFLENEVWTKSGTRHPLTRRSNLETGLVSFYSLPAALRDTSDRYRTTVTVRDGDAVRTAIDTRQNPEPFSFEFRDNAASATISEAFTTPYSRHRAVVPHQADYPAAARVGFALGSPTSVHGLSVMTTAAYLGGSPSQWELEFPDLTSAGFQPGWTPGQLPQNWTVEVVKGSVRQFLGGMGNAGDQTLSALRQFFRLVTPPSRP